MDIFKYKLNKIVFLALIGMPQIMPAAAPNPFWRIILQPNVRLEEAMTLEDQLYQALERGDERMVAFLLGAGVDSNTRYGPNLQTLAMKAAQLWRRSENRHSELALRIFYSIIEMENFDPNVRDSNNDTIAHYAIRNKSPELAECLFFNRPDIDLNALGSDGQTVMHLLLEKQITSLEPEAWAPIVSIVLDHPNWDSTTRNGKGQTVMDMLAAIKFATEELLERINAVQAANGNPQPEQELADLIVSTINEEDIGLIPDYFDEHPGFNINWQDPETGRTLPMYAVVTGMVGIVEALLARKRGYNFALKDKEGKTVFDYAEANRNEDMMNVLLAVRDGADMHE
ncbi:MAG: ankyrin repeat domain-containing protein [Puniceicoccales bacterium]|jgi:hypothetical protein|nr:ankyrin repeat domain-containing protein [Puniceicoccales bacterium]